MTTEQTTERFLRDQLGRATAQVPLGPDVEAAVRVGRRRRQRRHAGLALAAAVVVGAGAFGATVLRGGDQTVRDDTPAVGEPTATDFVAGTETDETMVAVVADHLPALSAPDDVYPSDAQHDGPMPDAEFGAATDWQAVYALGNGGRLLVLMGRPGPDEPFSCEGCTAVAVPGGTVYAESYRTLQPGEEAYVDGPQTLDAAGGEENHGVHFVRDDGFVVSAYERTPAGDDRTLTDDQLTGLVLDARLTF